MEMINLNKSVESLADIPQKLLKFHDNIEKSDFHNMVPAATSSPPKTVSTPTTKSGVTAVVRFKLFWLISSRNCRNTLLAS